mmetsp:Transcript_2738/g.5023  ORF Transcript_2738/g.5023 Transcript_2738/m.5023 type:complete len:96 (+) Transcript_2738:470-757(+)
MVPTDEVVVTLLARIILSREPLETGGATTGMDRTGGGEENITQTDPKLLQVCGGRLQMSTEASTSTLHQGKKRSRHLHWLLSLLPGETISVAARS